jgi:molecular chaperone IbpA
MRTFDLTPFYRSTVGFDRLFNLLDSTTGSGEPQTYPPYNIERTGEDAYRITMAVAGFGEADLTIEAKENTLTARRRNPNSSTAASARALSSDASSSPITSR